MKKLILRMEIGKHARKGTETWAEYYSDNTYRCDHWPTGQYWYWKANKHDQLMWSLNGFQWAYVDYEDGGTTIVRAISDAMAEKALLGL